MSADFDRAVRLVLIAEGVLSDNPNDRGGLTRFGISAAVYGADRVAKLTSADAIEIYRADYWNKLRCDDLPWQIALPVFDAAVNQGAPTAGHMLQAALRELGRDVVVDGQVGDRTIDAVHAVDPRGLFVWLMTLRAVNYARDAEFATFGRGWFNRLFQVSEQAFAPS